MNGERGKRSGKIATARWSVEIKNGVHAADLGKCVLLEKGLHGRVEEVEDRYPHRRVVGGVAFQQRPFSGAGAGVRVRVRVRVCASSSLKADRRCYETPPPASHIPMPPFNPTLVCERCLQKARRRLRCTPLWMGRRIQTNPLHRLPATRAANRTTGGSAFIQGRVRARRVAPETPPETPTPPSTPPSPPSPPPPPNHC